ncbi:glycosyltransferase family 8 protein [Vibrio parahaemolyticus]|uniref:Glycosyl transferase n=4 Tax=Vibrio parahaemolyticus TaxID=670 RepID=A0A5P5X5Z9_VIBPH|nr:glycosyltransferase family 8 protein [Vibrio parahaemolyticus]EJG1083039.1 glycosyltransferase family 8 protein [Vibrio parahaemolyticus]ELA8134595.1 glycosyltransferase family 8 protein [Vibrio parahaemolyticus]MBM4971156.1 glycosyltransferase family 8 protein [Vibrio parahaemolyticus]MCD1415103.1 glycosyltransferase family 8 protein [Vibrio parahaemolyticus]QFF90671.1 glycosyl transferase [Vibrio parahaemolyticus]
MINIALNIDENYVDYCRVLISSVLNYNKCVSFHILTNNLSAVSQKSITEQLNSKSFVYFYNIDSSHFEGMPKSVQWPEAIYYRLLVAEVLPKELKKVLYCDCDILFRGSIEDLWAVDIESYGVAAVEDVLSPISPMVENIGCNPMIGYFNSGVMLINLDFWRDRKVSQRTLNYIRENINVIKHPDQDALNYVLNNDWLKIHTRWNFLAPFQNSYYSHQHLMADYKKISKFYPIIVHFSGPKPWHPSCKSIYKFEYFELSQKFGVHDIVPKLRTKDYLEYYLLHSMNNFGIRPLKVNYFLNDISERN